MKKTESGQALVVVLLSLSVVLTLVLFILSRSVTDISVSSNDEEAVRAFSAAEAGIERALVIGTGSSNVTIGDATFTSSITNFAEASATFNYPLNLSGGETAVTWFTAHDENGNTVCDVSRPCFTGNSMKVCWGTPGTSSSDATTPALEVTIFYESTPGDISSVAIARGVYDPNASRRSSNNFVATDGSTCTIDGVSYAFSKTITFSSLGIPSSAYNFSDGLQFVRTRMLYNSTEAHPVGVDVNFASNLTLPSQGIKVVSTGKAGNSNRRLNVFQGFSEPPSVFDYVIYSSSGLTK